MIDEHAEDREGLEHDLKTLRRMADRRSILRWMIGTSLVPLVGCGGEATAAGTGSDGGVTSCSTIPEETQGPFPGDGSNGANALSLSGIARSDIRSSIGGASGVADGVLLTIELALVNSNSACAALAGYAVYVWHCNRSGLYSMYSAGVTGENYLRGVQQTDSSGKVTFTSIFPACYSGRWPHIHFEIYPSLSLATSSANKIATSQLALPKTACDEVYATSAYSGSASNLAQVSLATDNVFSDGSSTQVPTVSGSVANGYLASLLVGIGQ
jgi:protocatechuate 3,4-dioxygenase beta subunit